MKLANATREALPGYVDRQLRNFFPDDHDALPTLVKHIPEALERLRTLINRVRPWQENEFDVLHSTQYCTFLYFLANTIWRHESRREVCTRLFLLNKALNGIDLFYEIEMPEVFFIGHSVGIVLAKASYGNFLVLYQNSTVGKNHGIAPTIEEGVVLYPNTAVIGRSRVRAGTVVSQGTSVINTDTPGGCIVFSGANGTLVFKEPRRETLEDFFR